MLKPESVMSAELDEWSLHPPKVSRLPGSPQPLQAMPRYQVDLSTHGYYPGTAFWSRIVWIAFYVNIATYKRYG